MAFKPQSKMKARWANQRHAISDVMLVLVIILLVTRRYLRNRFMLSYQKPRNDRDINAQPLQLGIDAQGAITINKNPIADLAALEIALKAELAKSRNGVHIYADQAVVYAKLQKWWQQHNTRA